MKLANILVYSPFEGFFVVRLEDQQISLSSPEIQKCFLLSLEFLKLYLINVGFSRRKHIITPSIIFLKFFKLVPDD